MCRNGTLFSAAGSKIPEKGLFSMGMSIAIKSAGMTGITADRLFERLMVGASAFVLLGAAAVLDDQVRDRATGVLAGSAMQELSAAYEQTQRALQQAVNTVGYQSNENGTMLLFVVAAAFLFFVMLRT